MRVGKVLRLSAPIIFAISVLGQRPDETKSSNETLVKVVVGRTSGFPGIPARVLVYRERQNTTKIRRLRLGVEFESPNIHFAGFALSSGTICAGTTVAADSHEDATSSRTSVSKILIHITNDASSGIPPACSGEITFIVDPDAPNLKIPLRITLEATEVGATSPLAAADVKVNDGEIDVVPPGSTSPGPLTGCFFFAH